MVQAQNKTDFLIGLKMSTENRHKAYIATANARISEALDDLVDPDAPLVLLDWPNHTNIGDSAIWLGNVAYFTRRGVWPPAYVTRHTAFPPHLEALHPEGTIFLHGGGNFGEIYPAIHQNRLNILRRFPGRRIVQLPQSISFQTDAETESTRRAIGEHGNFVLLVRDLESAELARRIFECEVRLCPDMAFCLGAQVAPRTADVSVFGLMRQDVEARSSDRDATITDRIDLNEDWTLPHGFKVGSGLLYSAARRHAGLARLLMPRIADGFTAKSEQLFRHGLGQLSRGKVVVTDRLHGHIMATLLGIPHVVLDNSYGKIARYRAAWPGADLATVWDGRGDIADLVVGPDDT